MSRQWLLVVLLLGLSGCALFRENNGPPRSFTPREQLYYASFDNVWRCAQLALQNYPMRINNMDVGIIETDVLRGYKIWTPPYSPGIASGGLGYYLSLHLVKGTIDGRETIKVSVVKNLELHTDFFADPKKLASDGLEEKTILYRIGRELQIEKALEKAQKKAKPKISNQDSL
jgi:hypothetical protein